MPGVIDAHTACRGVPRCGYDSCMAKPAKHCVQIQISNRFCGDNDVVGYRIAMFPVECADQQICNNFSI